MKWYTHLLLYLLSCAIVEFLLVTFFMLDSVANSNPSVWSNFHIPQIGLPFYGLAVWIMLEGLIRINDKTAKMTEWYAKNIETLLKDYEKIRRKNNELNNGKH